MDILPEPATYGHHFGIAVISYVVSLAGAQTTLEILTKRTHIKGFYNWFLLTSASFTMGAVAVWAMHFIGNNSLMLLINGGTYMISYRSGFTFVSLLVSCVCMFLTFVSVGITEKAEIKRILPCGIFGGLGIVCTHYLGQFSIDYFVLKYRWMYLVGAILVACVSMTTALWIFFKLRERWINCWYKRLFCAVLMASATSAVHYISVGGTLFYFPNSDHPPPLPSIEVPEVIAAISVVLVLCLIILLVIIVVSCVRSLPKYNRNNNKRLVLDAVIFDSAGRILVKVDGTLPMKEIARNVELNETKQEFSVHHPLFCRLFDASVNRSRTNSNLSLNKTSCDNNTSSSVEEAYNMIENRFVSAMDSLRRELRFDNDHNMGTLSDIVIKTDSISKSSIFTKSAGLFVGANNSKSAVNQGSSKKYMIGQIIQHDKYTNSSDIEMGMTSTLKTISDDENSLKKSKSFLRINRSNSQHMSYQSKSSWNKHYNVSNNDDDIIETVSDIERKRQQSSDHTTINSTNHFPSEDISQGPGSVVELFSLEDYDSEDKHLFLVTKIHDDSEISNLMSQGYRFAETIFISKIMASKLHIPADYMRCYFIDMHRMVDSICALTQKNWNPYAETPAPDPSIFTASGRKSVCVGNFVILDETEEHNNMHIIVDKSRIFSFPFVQMKYENGDGDLIQLERKEINFIKTLHGKSLFEVASLQQTLGRIRTISEDLPSNQFMKSLESSAKYLLDSTSYSKGLFQSSKLHAAVIDIPPFTITTGPCQLILFKSFVNTPGATTAINYTFSESIKCIPFNLYNSLSIYLTDKAASIYKLSIEGEHNECSIDQQVYRSASSHAHYFSNDFNRSISPIGDISENDEHKSTQSDNTDFENIEAKPCSSSANPSSNIHNFSLPPPPRMKRKVKKDGDILLAPPKDPSPVAHVFKDTYLKVLPAEERFSWIKPITQNTIH
ncbi:hypothetical protein BDB01DRAFT_780773 [Pilobolus umbonatus]|nr:hypothetical protein BDB01DRAFT_780773 [Pilobolus umbonatus]